MARKRYSDEDALKILREVDVHLHDGMDVADAVSKAGVFKKTTIVGMDLVKFTPEFDVSNVTSRTLAELLLFALSKVFRKSKTSSASLRTNT